jgi:uncharacterized membrane protein YidH (DUF202 family)
VKADLPDQRDETKDERDDRNLIELLQELRVAGLGIQVLFGFLLALPFTTRFDQLNPAQRDLYIGILVVSAVATALLLGPVAYHRLVFRRRLKEPLVEAANVMAIWGLIAVAVAVCATVLLVVSFVANGLPVILISVCLAAFFFGLWFALPIARRQGAPRQGGADGPGEGR